MDNVENHADTWHMIREFDGTREQITPYLIGEDLRRTVTAWPDETIWHISLLEKADENALLLNRMTKKPAVHFLLKIGNDGCKQLEYREGDNAFVDIETRDIWKWTVDKHFEQVA